MIAVIQNIGGIRLSGFIYDSWSATLPEEITDKFPYFECSMANMKEIAKTAEECRVLLDVEVLNQFEQFLLNTYNEDLDYVKKVGSPNVEKILNMYHINIEEDSIEDAIVKAGNKLGHLYIGENNRKPPGKVVTCHRMKNYDLNMY